MRNLLALSVAGAATLMLPSVLLFAHYRDAGACTHGISSAGPVTIVDGKVTDHGKTYTRACLQ